jgi:3-hydroxyisobutyrate dehydrogenase
MTVVAVLGTGTMGAPMVRNLVGAGFEVRAWNRSPEKAEGLGATACGDAAEAIRGAEVVVTMLSDGDAVDAALDAAGELPDGAVWAQMSTVGVAAAERLAQRAGGAAYVDAPVVGTKQPAEQGELVVLASGPDDALERCAPVFDAVGKQTVRLGEAGAGNRMKVVINTWLVGLVETLAESIALAERIGVDPARFIETIEGGPLFAPYAKLKGTAMIEESFDPSFALGLAAKDARLAQQAARDVDLDVPLVDAVVAALERGVEAGHGDLDLAAAVRTLRG